MENLKSSIINEKRQGILVREAVKQLMTYLVSKYAILSWGPIGWIVTAISTKYAKLFIQETLIGVNSLIIDFTVDKDVTILQNVRDKINTITEETTKEELDAIDEAFANASRELIKFGRRKL